MSLPKVGASKRRLLIALAILAAAYFVVGFYFWSTQDRAILKPIREIAQTPADLQPPLDYEPVEFAVQAVSVHAYWLPAPDDGLDNGTDNGPELDDAPVALYLHGQDGTIGKYLDHAQCLHRLGCHVLVIDYRGYGKTYGAYAPSEASLYEDADAAWDYLTNIRGYSPKQILIYGHSLGGAVAIELASRHPDAGGLVTESTFTSVKQMARWKFAVTYALPLDLLLRHRFDSLSKVQTRELPPTLFIHGKADTKVPCRMSTELHDAARGPRKEIELLDGGAHARRGSGQQQYEQVMSAFLEDCF